MKKLVFLLAVLILSSCSENFLELYPKTSLNKSNFFQSEDQFITLTNGCYIPLRDYNKMSYWVLTELRSDNTSFLYHTNFDTQIKFRAGSDFFVLESDNVFVADVWNNAYSGITNCNVLLDEIGKTEITWSSTAIKERCMGEAYFLRALYYFNMVGLYGGVPIVLEPITAQEAVGIKRSTVEQVYEVIENDLKDAISHFSNATDVEENGRANWGAAKSLLGKVYLTLHNYPAAETELNAVITSNKYTLLANYSDLFNPAKKDFKETIFAIEYSEATVATANQFIFWMVPNNSGGEITGRPNISISDAQRGFNIPTQDLIDAFEPGDLRKDVSIKWWTGPDGNSVVRNLPYTGKFKPPVSAPDARCSDNMPVLRYSDVLLMYAEALNNQTKTGQAIPYVEQVRNRAGLMNSLAGYGQSELNALIAKERQVEFCFENQRWFDLIRTGKAIEVMTAHGVREKATKPWVIDAAYQVDADKLVIPIPVQEVISNHLEQNPGY